VVNTAAKRSLTLTYRKFLTMRSRANKDESVLGEEMTALNVGDRDDEGDIAVRALVCPTRW
jgi:Ca2+-binding EF-hand superfamily protein